MAFKKLKLWFDKDLALLLSNKIRDQDIDFASSDFIRDASIGVATLELKDRVTLFAELLSKYLGGNYKKNVDLLISILGPENEEETGMFTNYYWVMPIAKYIELYGLDYFDTSMRAIYEITKRNTGEYTIRPFMEHYPKKTLRQMFKWSKDKNKHVRRLASEGGSPRLPWASKIQMFVDDPQSLLPILDNLKDDPSRYVQKSVANCVNDIIKDNLEIAKSIIEDWNVSPSKERKWIIKHALRNLIKQEDEWALRIINQ